MYIGMYMAKYGIWGCYPKILMTSTLIIILRLSQVRRPQMFVCIFDEEKIVDLL